MRGNVSRCVLECGQCGHYKEVSHCPQAPTMLDRTAALDNDELGLTAEWPDHAPELEKQNICPQKG